MVEQTDVKVAVLAYFVAGEKTPKADAIVEGDEHDIVARGLYQLGTVPVGVGKTSVAYHGLLSDDPLNGEV